MISKAARISLALAACIAVLRPVSAQDFKPVGPVTMIVPFGAGGGSDLMARAMAGGSSSVRQGVQISVDNRPGGNGVLGYSLLKQSHGNPQVLLASETAAVALPLLIDPPPFNWHDFTPIAQMAGDSQLLVVAYDAPAKTLTDFVAAAKQRKLKVGLTSTTSSDAIVAKLFEDNQSLSFQHVVLESGSVSVARLIAGDIDFTILNPSETIGQMRAQRLRPLAVFADQRYTAETSLGDVPTAKELGVDVSFVQYRGLFAAGSITAAQATFWADAIEEWTKTESYKAYISKNNLF